MKSFSDYLIAAKNATSIEERELNLVKSIAIINDRLDKCKSLIRSYCEELYFVSSYDECTVVYMLDKVFLLKRRLEDLRSLERRLLSLKNFLNVGFKNSVLNEIDIDFVEGNEREHFI